MTGAKDTHSESKISGSWSHSLARLLPLQTVLSSASLSPLDIFRSFSSIKGNFLPVILPVSAFLSWSFLSQFNFFKESTRTNGASLHSFAPELASGFEPDVLSAWHSPVHCHYLLAKLLQLRNEISTRLRMKRESSSVFPQHSKSVLSYEHITTTVPITQFWVIHVTAHLPHQSVSVFKGKESLSLLSFFSPFSFSLSPPAFQSPSNYLPVFDTE